MKSVVAAVFQSGRTAEVYHQGWVSSVVLVTLEVRNEAWKGSKLALSLTFFTSRLIMPD